MSADTKYYYYNVCQCSGAQLRNFIKNTKVRKARSCER